MIAAIIKKKNRTPVIHVKVILVLRWKKQVKPIQKRGYPKRAVQSAETPASKGGKANENQ